MPAENPYEMETGRLLDEFMNACGRAGSSNSGMVIDVMAGNHLRYAHELRAAVLAKIDHASPPFKIGDRVHAKTNPITPLPVDRYSLRGSPRQIDTILVVKRVKYLGEGQWTLWFGDDNPTITTEEYDDDMRRYPVSLPFAANDFALEPQSAPATTA